MNSEEKKNEIRQELKKWYAIAENANLTKLEWELFHEIVIKVAMRYGLVRELTMIKEYSNEKYSR